MAFLPEITETTLHYRLSISFPNYRMFYSLRQNNVSDWNVIQLDAAILWELRCAFCRENAASNMVTHIPLEVREKIEALELMFHDLHQHTRNQLGIPARYPTNPQAEVLVLEPIPTRYIQEVHFETKASLDEWLNEETPPHHCKVLVNNQYFKPRCDFAYWKNYSISNIEF